MKSPPLKKVAKQTTLSGSGRASTMMAKKGWRQYTTLLPFGQQNRVHWPLLFECCLECRLQAGSFRVQNLPLKSATPNYTCRAGRCTPESIMIFSGPYDDVTIPEVSLTDFILKSNPELKDKRALIDGPTGRSLTYGQLEDDVRRTAASLANRGFKKGDVFAILSTNRPQSALAFHPVAILRATTPTSTPL